MGVELTLRGPRTTAPLRPDYEHALVVLQGRVTVDGVAVEPGVLAYLGLGGTSWGSGCRAGAGLAARRRALPEPILMWWNFVGRTREEVSEARRQWSADDGRSAASVPRWSGSTWGAALGVTGGRLDYQSPQPGGLTVPVTPRGSTGSRVAPAS